VRDSLNGVTCAAELLPVAAWPIIVVMSRAYQKLTAALHQSYIIW